MARRDRSGGGNETDEVNLVPFMNMVVVLIPMLLLSVVFLKIGVINITSPELSVGEPSEPKKKKKDEKPLNLTVAVADNGLRIGATGAILPPEQGCPSDGPTLCLADDSIDVESKVEQAREQFEKGNVTEGKKLFSEAASAYDWMGLYNKLSEIKKEYPDETVVKISANPDIPYDLIVTAMDTVRHKLQKDSYDNRKDFWQAKPKTETKNGKKIAQPLFNDPVLSIAK
jgi:biopolymer transport protein ExbD